MSDQLKLCHYCQQVKESLKHCAACKSVFYCDQLCQLRDWNSHKEKCLSILKQKQSRINEFQVYELIGQGNYTNIHKAYDKTNNWIVALKSAIKQKMIKQQKDKEILVEVHCLQKLKDIENVVKFYEFFEDDFSMYISQELIEGKELFEIAKVFGMQNKSLIKRLFYQILSTVKQIHDKGICHRDLKPENIMLTDINNCQLKIIDFGTAKDIELNIKGPGNGSTGRNFFENYVGTPHYMPPECINNKSSDYMSDVYCLAGVLYFLYTGFPPYNQATEYLIFKEKLDKIEPVFYDFVFEKETKDLIQKMMSFESQDRPTVEEILLKISHWKDIDNKDTEQEDYFFDCLTTMIKQENFNKEKMEDFFNVKKDYIQQDFKEQTVQTWMLQRLELLSKQTEHFYDIKKFNFSKIETVNQFFDKI